MPLIRAINSLCVVRGSRPEHQLRFPPDSTSVYPPLTALASPVPAPHSLSLPSLSFLLDSTSVSPPSLSLSFSHLCPRLSLSSLSLSPSLSLSLPLSERLIRASHLQLAGQTTRRRRVCAEAAASAAVQGATQKRASGRYLVGARVPPSSVRASPPLVGARVPPSSIRTSPPRLSARPRPPPLVGARVPPSSIRARTATTRTKGRAILKRSRPPMSHASKTWMKLRKVCDKIYYIFIFYTIVYIYHARAGRP